MFAGTELRIKFSVYCVLETFTLPTKPGLRRMLLFISTGGTIDKLYPRTIRSEERCNDTGGLQIFSVDMDLSSDPQQLERLSLE